MAESTLDVICVAQCKTETSTYYNLYSWFNQKKIIYSKSSTWNHNVKKILLEIGFNKKIEITWGNKEVPKSYSTITLIGKTDLIRLTP